MKIIKIIKSKNVSYNQWINKTASVTNPEWLKIGQDTGYLNTFIDGARNSLEDLCDEYFKNDMLKTDLLLVLDRGIDKVEDVGEDVEEDYFEIQNDLIEIKNKYNLNNQKLNLLWRFFSTIFKMILGH